ncbi:MAG TPA: MGMT family protein [Cellvibrio sp.]|nr:MGMT family protein [Cellvibrio sp.]
MHNQQQQQISAIYAALAQVPEGRVISYGKLAKLAGMPNGARFVGRLMCRLPEGTQLPWHRVINAQGKLSLPPESDSYREQKLRLINEGVEFVNEKINLSIYGYNS